MKAKRYFLSFVLAAIACSSQAQIAQAVAASITNDSVFTGSSYITIGPTSTTSANRWLDIRATFLAKCTPFSMVIPTTAQYGEHDYGGYVKVKYIGAGTPPAGNVGGKFAVWSMRYGGTEIRVIKSSPGSRWLYADSTIASYYLTYIAYSSMASSPGFDQDKGGDTPSGGIYGEPLPSLSANGAWTRMADYATSAPFNLEADGYYYAYYPMAGVTAFTTNFDGATTGTWDGPLYDYALGGYTARIAYQLVEVDTQPVL